MTRARSRSLAAVLAEGRRLRYSPLTPLFLLAGVMAPFALTAGLILIGPEHMNPPMPGIESVEGVRGLISVVVLSAPIPAIMGSLSLTSEYSHRTMVPTFLAEPRRWPVLVAKVLTISGLGVTYGAATGIGAFAGILTGASVTAAPLALSPEALALTSARLGAGMALYAVLGAGLGALLRRQLLTAGIIFVWLYFGESLISVLPGGAAVYPWLPGGAVSALIGHSLMADAIGRSLGTGSIALLSPAVAALVLMAYTGILSAIALLVPLRREA